MARINVLSDGQPITYGLINQIINSINDLEPPERDTNQAIDVYGKGIRRGDNERIVIISDTESPVTISKNSIATNIEVKFKNGVFSSPPVVTATLVDSRRGDGISLANLTITEVAKTHFKAKIKLLQAADSETNLKINYIAVGAGTTT